MKFTIQREKLVSLIGKIQNVVPSKGVVPILVNILVEAIGHEIFLFATDLTVSMRTEAEAEVAEEGAIALPARRFFQLIRELTTPEITLETTVEGVAIITSGSSHFRLHGMDRREFPTFPDISGGLAFSLESEELKEMFVNTAFAAARDDNRQVLNGVYMEIEAKRVTLVGTDGKRLAKVQNSISTEREEEGKSTSIIPLKAVEEIIRLLDNKEKVTLTLMSDKISIEAGSITLISKLLSGQFPDYERVMPSAEGMERITLHREELITLLKQVSLFTSEVSHSVRLTFTPGELRIQAVNSDIGEGRVAMPVDYDKEKIEIAFNPHYFIDILRHCKEETVNFGLTDSFNPGSITDSSNSHFVIMPMRLSVE